MPDASRQIETCFACFNTYIFEADCFQARPGNSPGSIVTIVSAIWNICIHYDVCRELTSILASRIQLRRGSKWSYTMLRGLGFPVCTVLGTLAVQALILRPFGQAVQPVNHGSPGQALVF